MRDLRRRSRLAAAVLLAAVVLAACSDEPAKHNRHLPEPGKYRPPANELSDAKPPEFEVKPLWTETSDPTMKAISHAEFMGEQLLLVGGSNRSWDMVTVADAATGKVRWLLGDGEELPGTEGGLASIDGIAPPPLAAGEAVLVPYLGQCEADDTCAEPDQGLAAIGATDGKLRWKLEMVPRQTKPKAGGGVHQLMAADERLALSTVADEFSDDADAVRVIATDVADGGKLWESKGMWPQHLVGDTVIGVRSPEAPDGLEPTPDEKISVVALDARTGKKRWDLKGRYPQSFITAVTDKHVVIEDSGEHSVVVDLATGREVADLPAARECVSDGKALVACRDDAARGVGIRTYDGRTGKSTAGSYLHLGSGPDLVWRDLVFMRGLVVDAAGKYVSRALPEGRPKQISGDLALFITEDHSDSGSFAVNRVAG